MKMALSQTKLTREKRKRKDPKITLAKNKEVVEKSETENLKVGKKVKPMARIMPRARIEQPAETNPEEINVSRKRKRTSDQNSQQMNKNTMQDLCKDNEKKSTLKMKLRKRSDKIGKPENAKSGVYNEVLRYTAKDTKKKIQRKELCKELMQQSISAVLILTQEEHKNNLLIEDAQPIFMQVTCIRVPKIPRREIRMLLPYSIVAPDDEVALFVCDLQRGRRKDYEPTVEHYRNLLNEQGCTRINEIIPMNRVKTEFDQFELKRKLSRSYDFFLVDGRIAGHMSHLLGKEFIKKRKLPIPIQMQSKDLKHEIDYALRKTSMHIHSNGDSYIMQIGNTLMSKEQILKNTLAACRNLSKDFPGGWANVRSLRLKSTITCAIPFYMTLRNKNTVTPPVQRPKRPKAYHNVKGELSTRVTDTKVIVKPDGDVIVVKKDSARNMQKEK